MVSRHHSGNLSVMEFVDSDWSMLNDRLAAHYGINGVTGVQIRQVPLPDFRYVSW